MLLGLLLMPALLLRRAHMHHNNHQRHTAPLRPGRPTLPCRLHPRVHPTTLQHPLHLIVQEAQLLQTMMQGIPPPTLTRTILLLHIPRHIRLLPIAMILHGATRRRIRAFGLIRSAMRIQPLQLRPTLPSDGCQVTPYRLTRAQEAMHHRRPHPT